ncbi:MAG: hypothetical protein ABIE94_06560 [archaeon]
MLIVQCPRCKHRMKYQPMGGEITSKVKRCVYCGYSFKVHSSLKTDRIVKVEK